MARQPKAITQAGLDDLIGSLDKNIRDAIYLAIQKAAEKDKACNEEDPEQEQRIEPLADADYDNPQQNGKLEYDAMERLFVVAKWKEQLMGRGMRFFCSQYSLLWYQNSLLWKLWRDALIRNPRAVREAQDAEAENM